MDRGFWDTLKRPIMVLAPMADVTDAAFRRIIAKYGKPDVIWTEFVSADGLFLGGRDKLIRDLDYTEAERPIVAQFFTSEPSMMRKAAELARELGFDGIDINMGCPDRSIEKQGAGAALMRNPKLAREIIREAKAGAWHVPVSVKTRVGWNKVEIDEWLPELLKEEPAAITVHARTRKELSKVPARWEHVKRAVEIRNESGAGTLILGNGDVDGLDDARRKAAETGADGVMIGRGIFGKPWLFSGSDEYDDKENPETRAKVLRVMVEHTKAFQDVLGGLKNFAIMKKHYKAYANGFDGAKELRQRLMECENAAEVEREVEAYIGSLRLPAGWH